MGSKWRRLEILDEWWSGNIGAGYIDDEKRGAQWSSLPTAFHFEIDNIISHHRQISLFLSSSGIFHIVDRYEMRSASERRQEFHVIDVSRRKAQRQDGISFFSFSFSLLVSSLGMHRTHIVWVWVCVGLFFYCRLYMQPSVYVSITTRRKRTCTTHRNMWPRKTDAWSVDQI